MMADDAQLLAYVDGGLSPDERNVIEAQLRESPEARKKLALLRASNVDFADAFAKQPLPAVPETLRLSLDEMVRAHRAQGAASANDDAVPKPAASVHPRWRGVPVWLAAACVAGAFAVGQFAHLNAFFGSAPGDVRPPQAASAEASPWVAAAVGYQKLYTRDTVSYRADDPALAARVVADIRDHDRIALRVPDLSTAGLSFRSVQRLRFNGKPLVQIVYLPKNGAPIALCVMKDARPDEAVASRRVDQMDVTTWRQGEMSYALIGQPGDVDLGALGKRISNADMTQLFGKITSAGSDQDG
jgi:anti-sigma factor RsiW